MVMVDYQTSMEHVTRRMGVGIGRKAGDRQSKGNKEKRRKKWNRGVGMLRP